MRTVAGTEGGAVESGLRAGDVVAEDGGPDPGEVGLGVAGGVVLVGARRGALPEEPEFALEVAAAKDQAGDGGVRALARGVELRSGRGGGGAGQRAGGTDGGGDGRVIPLVAPVLEIGIEPAGVDVRRYR